jgi:hypothetical protein
VKGGLLIQEQLLRIEDQLGHQILGKEPSITRDKRVVSTGFPFLTKEIEIKKE